MQISKNEVKFYKSESICRSKLSYFSRLSFELPSHFILLSIEVYRDTFYSSRSCARAHTHRVKQ